METNNQEFIRDPAKLTIADILPDRPTVGDTAPVLLWRLVRIIGLNQILGPETEHVIYFTGREIGKMLNVTTVDELVKALSDLKLGNISVPVNTPDSVHIGIEECITCAGIKPPLGRAICQMETGIIAGALETIFPGKKVTGRETMCIGGLGDPICLAECRII